jgi:hypothetical protein
MAILLHPAEGSIASPDALPGIATWRDLRQPCVRRCFGIATGRSLPSPALMFTPASLPRASEPHFPMKSASFLLVLSLLGERWTVDGQHEFSHSRSEALDNALSRLIFKKDGS